MAQPQMLASLAAGDAVNVVWPPTGQPWLAQITAIHKRGTAEVLHWLFDVVYAEKHQGQQVGENEVAAERLLPYAPSRPRLEAPMSPATHRRTQAVGDTRPPTTPAKERTRKRPRSPSQEARRKQSHAQSGAEETKHGHSGRTGPRQYTNGALVAAAEAYVGRRFRRGRGGAIVSGVVEAVERVSSCESATTFRLLHDDGDEELANFGEVKRIVVVEARSRNCDPVSPARRSLGVTARGQDPGMETSILAVEDKYAALVAACEDFRAGSGGPAQPHALQRLRAAANRFAFLRGEQLKGTERVPEALTRDVAAELHRTVAAAARRLMPNGGSSFLKVVSVASEFGAAGDHLGLPSGDGGDGDLGGFLGPIQAGLDAAVTLVSLWNSEKVSGSIFQEESVASMLQLLKRVMKGVLVPASTALHHGARSHAARKTRKKAPTVELSDTDRNLMDDTPPAFLRDACQAAVRLGVAAHSLMEKFLALLERVRLGEEHLTLLCAIARIVLTLPDYAVTAGRLLPLQHCALCVYESLFLGQPTMRSALVLDVFGIIPRVALASSQRAGARALPSVPTRFILSLVQATAADPPAADAEPGPGMGSNPRGAPSPAKAARSRGGARSDYVTALNVAHYFAAQFLERCKKREEGAEFRTALSSLCGEWLRMLPDPEWPAAEMLLHAMAIGLVAELSSHLAAQARGDAETGFTTPTSNADGNALETLFVSLALELLGRITATVVALTKVAPVRAEELLGPEFLGAATTTLRILARSRGDPFGPLEFPAAPGDAFDAATDAAVPVRGAGLLRHALTLYLTETGASEHCRRFRLARWVHEWARLPDTEDDDVELYLAQWRITDHARHATFPALSSAALVELGRAALQDGILVRSRDTLTRRLLEFLRAPVVAVRSRALKALSVVLEADADLMLDERVEGAVERCLSDEAISVRQAVVDLVGRYALRRLDFLNAYRACLLERVLDRGISVRKNVVKILAEALLRFPEDAGRVDICAALVRLLSLRREEDSMKELVTGIFARIWFGSTASFASPTVAAADPAPTAGGAMPGAATPTAAVGSPKSDPQGREAVRRRLRTPHSRSEASPAARDKQHVAQIACQIVEVVALHAGEPTWLVNLVSGLLEGLGEGQEGRKDRAKREVATRQRCRDLTLALMELLGQLEKGTASLPTLAELPPAQQLLAVLETLCVLSNAAPAALLPHLPSFYAYLKADNGVPPQTEGRLCELVCHMLSAALPVASHDVNGLDRRGLLDVATDLGGLVYKFGSATVDAAVHALCAVGAFVGDATLLAKLGMSFYNKLKAILAAAPEAPLSARDAPLLERGFVVLGATVRHWRETGTATAHEGAQDPAQRWLGGLPVLLTALLPRHLSRCLHESNASRVSLRLRLVDALTALFVGHPGEVLRLHEAGLLHQLLGDPAPGVVCRTVGLLREALEEEEARVESGAARREMAVKTETGVLAIAQQVRGDQDAEASICGGVAGMLMNDVRHHLYGHDLALRYEALRLQGTLLRQGLQNPNDCVEALVVLQADDCAPLVAEAFRQALLEHEKHPSFLLARFVPGVARAAAFQHEVLGEVAATREAAVEGLLAECVFHRIYATCLRSSRKHRRGILEKLVALLGLPGGSGGNVVPGSTPGARARQRSTAEALREVPGGTRFVAEVLGHLPYEQLDEVLFLLYRSSHTINLEAPHILASGLRELDAAGIPSTLLEDLGPAALAQTREVAAFAPEAEERCCTLADGATNMILLMVLHRFLKATYGISDARMGGFHPSQSLKRHQQSVHPSETIQPFGRLLDSVAGTEVLAALATLKHSPTPQLLFIVLRRFSVLVESEAATAASLDPEATPAACGAKARARPSGIGRRRSHGRKSPWKRDATDVEGEEQEGYYSLAEDDDDDGPEDLSDGGEMIEVY